MRREPSIHVTKTNLTKVLHEILSNDMDSKDINDVINKLLIESVPYSISSRTIVPSNNRLEKKAEKVAKSSRMDGDIFANALYMVRKKLKHRGISQIKPGTKDWDSIKVISQQALDFCNEFGIDKKQGFTKYIELGLIRMGNNKFNINRFNSLYETICEIYEANTEISDDDEPDITRELYQLYSKQILTQTGIFEDFSSEPEKYVWFVRARKQAKQLNIALDTYIEAQFEALDFTKGIPYPSQLVGPKANQRLYQFLYKKGLKLDNTTGK